MYALSGSGMHGKNGISPAITLQTFVLPRLLHGIELLDIRKKDLTDLEIYQRKALKQLQNLPETTASVAVLALLRAKTIEAQIDTKILTIFINIAVDPSTKEHQIALRQLLVKTAESSSWFIKVKHILHKYDLPEPEYLLQNIRSDRSKQYWKWVMKRHVDSFWHFQNQQEVNEKSTLSHFKLNSARIPHQLWLGSKYSPVLLVRQLSRQKL